MGAVLAAAVCRRSSRAEEPAANRPVALVIQRAVIFIDKAKGISRKFRDKSG